MAQISKSVATLRIVGEDLVPDDITTLLRCKPSTAQEKGQVLVGRKTGNKRTAKFGMWSLYAADHEPENLDAQVTEVLSKLSLDLKIWELLAEKYSIDLFCGIFMESSNEGMEISPSSLYLLGERGIALSLDIYDGNDDAPGDLDLCPCKSGKVYSECCGKNA